MSVVIHEDNKKREIRLKISKIYHAYDNFMADFMPASHPGTFNDALGLKILIKKSKSKKKWGDFQWFVMGIMLSAFGTGMVTQESSLYAGAGMAIIGYAMLIVSFAEKILLDENRDKDISNNTKENDEFKKDNKKMKGRIEELEKKVEELTKKLDA